MLDEHTVKIGDRVITSKSIVIATGSEPVIPKIKGLEHVSYLTNRNIFELKKLPKHLIILGGGPIGLELGKFKFIRNEGLKEYIPQKNYMAILATGEKKGIIQYKGMAIPGGISWKIKQFIDVKFMKKFKFY